MTINQVMNYGTEGMDTTQRQEEKERRVDIIIRINKIGSLMQGADEKRKRVLQRKLNTIKADERAWLREVAWFLY